MSYYKCKNISIKPKTNKLFVTVACNNLTPITYERLEYAEKEKYSLDEKLLYLMISMLDGNIQISQINKNTIPFEYALLKVRNYYRETNINDYGNKYDKRYELYDKELSKYVNVENWEEKRKFEKENRELTNDIEKRVRKNLYKQEFEIFKNSINEKINGKYYLRDDFERVIEYVGETRRGYKYRAYERPNKDCLLDYKLAYIIKDKMGKQFEICKYEETKNVIKQDDEEEIL